jgi:hypothetical protein
MFTDFFKILNILWEPLEKISISNQLRVPGYTVKIFGGTGRGNPQQYKQINQKSKSNQ